MTEPIFARLITEGHEALSDARTGWERVTSHLHHHPVTIAPEATPQDIPDQHEGAPMASLAELVSDVKTALEAAETPFRTVLDEHLPQLAALGQQVETDRLIQSAVTAAEHVPADLREAFADTLDKLIGSFAPAAASEPSAPPQADEPVTQSA